MQSNCLVAECHGHSECARADIKAEFKVNLILLAENGYPPVDRDVVYNEIFEQAENFKKYQGA